MHCTSSRGYGFQCFYTLTLRLITVAAHTRGTLNPVTSCRKDALLQAISFARESPGGCAAGDTMHELNCKSCRIGGISGGGENARPRRPGRAEQEGERSRDSDDLQAAARADIRPRARGVGGSSEEEP